MVNMVGQRNIIDASEAIDLYHVNHGGRAGGSDGDTSWGSILQTGVSGVYINRYLGYFKQPEVPYDHIHGFGTANEAPYKMLTTKTNAGVTIEKRKYWSKMSEENLIKKKCAGPMKVVECDEIKRIKVRDPEEQSDELGMRYQFTCAIRFSFFSTRMSRSSLRHSDTL